MDHKILVFYLCTATFFMGCAGPSEKIVEYPNDDAVELHLTILELHLVLEGTKFVKNKKTILLVRILDKDFSVVEDVNLECFFHTKGRRFYSESINQLSPGNFQIALRPTYSGACTLVFNIKGKEIDETLKLKVVVNG